MAMYTQQEHSDTIYSKTTYYLQLSIGTGDSMLDSDALIIHNGKDMIRKNSMTMILLCRPRSLPSRQTTSVCVHKPTGSDIKSIVVLYVSGLSYFVVHLLLTYAHRAPRCCPEQ